MKLLFCPQCQDVVKLQLDKRVCKCGESWGKYHKDELNASYGGKGFLLGFSNPSFASAWIDQCNHGDKSDKLGRTFVAFFIPQECDTAKKVD